jgi:hypothetical protein
MGQQHRARFLRSGRWAAALLLAGLSGAALAAQQPGPPPLEEILRRLEANLHHYDTAVPSLFCDEHAVSKVWPGPGNEDTVTDSVFRLKRTPEANHTTTLVESREIRTVNGKPAASQNLDGPTLLNGAFEGGLAVVSLSQSACMHYELQPINRKRPAQPYVIRFATGLTAQNSADCVLQEQSKGRAVIDPASMQITHLELTTPRHVMAAGDVYSPPVLGKRVITVDYAPVPLGGETFWMPSTIALQVSRGSGTFHMTVWSFEATYRNYHKLEVTSRIVPGSETPLR